MNIDPLKIEAVTVCVNYADFLAEVAPFNIPHLHRWLIVTTEDDLLTREVCRRLGLECLVTSEHTREGGFSKGRLIERGLQHLSAEGWRLHMDADIVLPFQTQRLLQIAHLDEKKIYGCDRIMIHSWQKWQSFKASGWLTLANSCAVNFPAGIQVGTRWTDSVAGFCPIGFFQLWHSDQDLWRGVRAKRYPILHNDSCRTDTQHALQWDRRQRELLPELIVTHLESEAAPLGANWKGRTTKPLNASGVQALSAMGIGPAMGKAGSQQRVQPPS